MKMQVTAANQARLYKEDVLEALHAAFNRPGSAELDDPEGNGRAANPERRRERAIEAITEDPRRAVRRGDDSLLNGLARCRPDGCGGRRRLARFRDDRGGDSAALATAPTAVRSLTEEVT
jgi:hypothetical protein